MDIQHDRAHSKFYILVDGSEALLQYKRGPENSFNLTHTLVPPAARGKGIAEELVKAALQEAKKEKVKVIATCSYVAKWFEKHPEEKSILLQK